MTHVLPDPLLAAPDPRCPLLPASRSAQPWPHPPAAGATSFRRGSALRGLGHCFSGSLSPRLPDKQHILQNILWEAFLVPPSLLLPPKGNGQSPFAFLAILQDTASVAVYFLCIFLANVVSSWKAGLCLNYAWIPRVTHTWPISIPCDQWVRGWIWYRNRWLSATHVRGLVTSLQQTFVPKQLLLGFSLSLAPYRRHLTLSQSTSEVRIRPMFDRWGNRGSEFQYIYPGHTAKGGASDLAQLWPLSPHPGILTLPDQCMLMVCPLINCQPVPSLLGK